MLENNSNKIISLEEQVKQLKEEIKNLKKQNGQ